MLHYSTTDFGSTGEIAAIYASIKEYYEPDYVSVSRSPCNFSAWPFTAVIELNAMTVLGTGDGPDSITADEVMNLVNQVNI